MQFQSHFHKNGFALGLVLKQRQKVVRGKGRRREGGGGVRSLARSPNRKKEDHGSRI